MILARRTDEQCWSLTKSTTVIVNGRLSSQEEAYTNTLPHAEHGSSQGPWKTVMHTAETDLFIITLSLLLPITNELFLLTGKQDKKKR